MPYSPHCYISLYVIPFRLFLLLALYKLCAGGSNCVSESIRLKLEKIPTGSCCCCCCCCSLKNYSLRLKGCRLRPVKCRSSGCKISSPSVFFLFFCFVCFHPGTIATRFEARPFVSCRALLSLRPTIATASLHPSILFVIVSATPFNFRCLYSVIHCKMIS